MNEAIEALRTENAALRQRVAELEARNLYLTDFIDTIYNHVPYVIFVCNVLENNQFLTHSMNQMGSTITGLPVETWDNKTFEEIHDPEAAEAIQQRCLACIEAGKTIDFEEHLTFPAGEIWTQSLYTPVYNADGVISRIVGTAFDITERKRKEQREQQDQATQIEEQSINLAKLSTPLIPVADDVVIMPLIGAIDSQRADQVMETLLHGVAEHRARLAILDITGVAVVDTQVAQAFIQAAQAVRLLGARVMITGIQPAIAQTLVQLGVDLTGITTRSSLQDGIAAALQQR